MAGDLGAVLRIQTRSMEVELDDAAALELLAQAGSKYHTYILPYNELLMTTCTIAAKPSPPCVTSSTPDV